MRLFGFLRMVGPWLFVLKLDKRSISRFFFYHDQFVQKHFLKNIIVKKNRPSTVFNWKIFDSFFTLKRYSVQEVNILINFILPFFVVAPLFKLFVQLVAVFSETNTWILKLLIEIKISTLFKYKLMWLLIKIIIFRVLYFCWMTRKFGLLDELKVQKSVIIN